jgi:hypothetical protein
MLNRAEALKRLKEKLSVIAQDQALSDFNEIKGDLVEASFGMQIRLHIIHFNLLYFDTIYFSQNDPRCDLYMYLFLFLLSTTSHSYSLFYRPKGTMYSPLIKW